MTKGGVMEFTVGKTKIRLIKGDITNQETDAVVNAANSSLMGGGGVDGAIHKRGGPEILKECKKIRKEKYPDGLPTGQAVITTGGDLKARYVIHTVGPIYRGGNRGEEELLADAYRNCLRVAVKNGLKTISLPSISTGAYGYPIKDASRIALEAAKEYLEEFDRLDEVVFVLFSGQDLGIYEDAARQVF